MQQVPLVDAPSQSFGVQLNRQNCNIEIRTASTGLYVSLSVDNSLLIGGVIAEDRNRMVRSAYLGFQGDLVFVDTQGASDPSYPGLGTRYQLFYLSASEVAALQ